MNKPILLQRIESGLILLSCLYFYHYLHYNFLLFILLFFVIDIFMVGYLKDSKVGALSYNLAHNFAVPAVLIGLGTVLANNLLIGGGLIWAAHVSLDRVMGYGIKFDSSFHDTHLGKIGKK